MKLRYRKANYIGVLMLQWAVLIPGTLLILGGSSELRAYGWIVVILTIIPPLFTILLYYKWLIIVDEKCFHLSPPLKRKKAELYFKDISEITLTNRKGEKIIKVLKDNDSNLYLFGRLLNPKDSARLWKYMSRRIEELGLDVEVKRE